MGRYLALAVLFILGACASSSARAPALAAATLVDVSRTLSVEMQTASDAERISTALIEHYLTQATHSRTKRRNGELSALALSTGSLLALGLNWRSDFAVAAGFAGPALRQYLNIDQPRGPTPWLTSVNQTACIVAQLPPLIEFEEAYPTVADRRGQPQMDRIYNNAISSVRNGIWVIYANYQAATGDASLPVHALSSHEEKLKFSSVEPLSNDDQIQLAVRMTAALSQITTCPRMIVNAGY